MATGAAEHSGGGATAFAETKSATTEDTDMFLSFRRHDFLADSFAPVGFVAARKHLPVDQFKHDLHGTLRVLKTELVELINNDYAQFISLSTNLVGVDSMISDLKKPLSRIQANVETVQGAIDGVIDRLETGLQKRALVRTKKAALEVFLSIHESLEKVQAVIDSSAAGSASGSSDDMDEKLLERVAIEYNQLRYLVSRGQNLAFVSNIAWRIENIKNTLVSTLSNYVRQGYTTLSVDPSNASAASSLLQTLRVFVLIDRVGDALNVFDECILGPFVDESIRADSVDLAGVSTPTGTPVAQSSNPLQDMLDRVLMFVTTRCSRIYDITTVAFKGTHYDLLANTIWTRIITAIVTKLPIIFNAGIPSIFHGNYQTAMAFVCEFERMCKSRDALRSLRNSQPYSDFMRKWQLSIYFQIRHNEIAVKFETAIAIGREPRDPIENGSLPTFGGASLQLKASVALIQALSRCWDDTVYLGSLSHRFWRFTLQLISRYSDWLHKAISDELQSGPPSKNGMGSTAQLNASAESSESISANASTSQTFLASSSSISAAGGLGGISDDAFAKQTLGFHSDMLQIRDDIMLLYTLQIAPKLPAGSTDNPILLDSLTLALDEIQSAMPELNDRIVSHFTRKCVEPLRSSVKNIPGLYRRTNKETPTKCSYFVPAIFRPLTTFVHANYERLDRRLVDDWQDAVARAVTHQYLEQVKETLASVRAIEESLKRLKKVKKATTTASAGEDALSDDDKIRLQIFLDAQQYGVELTQLGVECNSIPSYVELMQIVSAK
ncbi:hypothetical protein BC831DRAFT_450556 [Entophlyctis helioformis]|nr:hypothetical protein BC831DRAFT_450556 [Entophlyctis helioformis]